MAGQAMRDNKRNVSRRNACVALASLALVAIVPGILGCSRNRGSSVSFKNDWSHSLTADDVREAARQAKVDVSDVAAVAMGEVITWRDVDARVQQERIRQGISDNVSASLDEEHLTRGSERARALKALVDDALVSADADRRGIDVDEESIDEQIKSLSDRYPSHSAFVNALEAAGYTEDSYRDAVRASALSQRLREAVAPTSEPTDEQVREYAVVMASTLAGKRSSQILLAQDDYVLAQRLRQRAFEGEDFAELARKYSIDGSASDGGDMGWDSLNPMNDEYQKALDKLNVGDISPVVRSSFGYHIIKCTDIYEVTYDENGDVDISAMPTDLLNSLKSSMSDALAEQAYARYLENLEATAALAVFDTDGTWIDPAQIGLATEVPASSEVSVSDLIDDSDVSDGEVSGEAASV